MMVSLSFSSLKMNSCMLGLHFIFHISYSFFFVFVLNAAPQKKKKKHYMDAVLDFCPALLPSTSLPGGWSFSAEGTAVGACASRSGGRRAVSIAALHSSISEQPISGRMPLCFLCSTPG